MDFLLSLLPAVEHFQFLGYLVVLLVAFFESIAFIGIAIPGSTFVIFIGFISSGGFLDLGDVVWFAAIGAIIGDTLSYYLGSNVDRFFKKDNKIFKSKYLEKGKTFFGKYGGRSIFLGRFIGPIRPIIPFVAGMFKMKIRNFFLWDIFSSFAWATAFLLIGFFFGQAWETIVLWSERSSLLIAGLVFFIVVFYILDRFVIKRGKRVLRFLVSVLRSIKHAVIYNHDVKRILNKHPVFFRFIRMRFNKSNFFGLPTTLLLFAFLLSSFLFAGIVESIVTSESVMFSDLRIANLLVIFRSADITEFFIWITLLGKSYVVLAFLFTTIFIMWIMRKRLYIAPLFLAVVGGETFAFLGKNIIRRPRPEVALYTEHSFSFPSGHAMIAVAFYGFLTYVFIRELRRWKIKVNLFFIGLAIIFLIGFSRLYLGVHYASDVWGGYLVGVLWLVIGISVSEWLLSIKKDKVSFIPQTKSYIISYALIIVSILFYTVFALNYNPQISQPVILDKENTVLNIEDIFTEQQSKYTEFIFGGKQEPISFIILAKNDTEFKQLFTDSGWFLADDVNIPSVIKIAKKIILKEPYPQAPMTPSFWNTKIHSFGFEKPTNINNARQRHHARFWKTNYITKDGKRIYVGTASLDIGIKWGVTHKISPDIDTEREFLFSNIRDSNTAINFKRKKFVNPVLGQNFSGDPFFTDGEVYIMSVY